MADRARDIQEWQARLSAAFEGPSGIVGERLLQISGAEKLHRQHSVREFKGFMTLMDAFQDFTLQTLNEAQRHGHVLNVFSFAFVGAAFQRLRVALNECYNGYYFDAAASLRSVFESVLYLGAVANGHIKFDALLEAAHRIDYEGATEAKRRKVERTVQVEIDTTIKREMRGADSGLSESDQHELELMFVVLHTHVHKAASSIIEFIHKMMVERRGIGVAPAMDSQRASIFCNHAVCVTWGFLRVLPCLSLPSRFSENWSSRYRVLDDSFRFYLSGWDKPLRGAFLRFIDRKMSFTDESFVRFEVDREKYPVVTATI